MKTSKPDFGELRRKRDEAIKAMVVSVCEEAGWNPAKITCNASHTGCYCACPDGPCEHEFDGWREFDSGGEQVCTKCGQGAMSHSLRVAP